MPETKTWQQKLNEPKSSKVKRIEKSFADIPAGSNMFIATPQIVNDYINQIEKGKSVSVQTMRKDLAMENNAEYTCPVTTGIFLKIVAEAAYEKFIQTKTTKNITPFWRIIDPGSALAEKLSFGKEFLLTQRKKEKL